MFRVKWAGEIRDAVESLYPTAAKVRALVLKCPAEGEGAAAVLERICDRTI